MTLRVTILGCGSSAGVPRVGVGWGACDPSNPKNRRRRCSILVEKIGPDGITTVLVDTATGPARSTPWRRCPAARRRSLHPRACRPHPRHRRPAAARHRSAPANPRLCRPDDERTASDAVRLLFRYAGRKQLSADPEDAPFAARRQAWGSRTRADPARPCRSG